MVDVAPERFDAMVGEALDGLPSHWVDWRAPYPSPWNTTTAQPACSGSPAASRWPNARPTTRRSARPDHIYRRAICSTDQEVVEQVHRTVAHEIGHHFGIDDARLHELGSWSGEDMHGRRHQRTEQTVRASRSALAPSHWFAPSRRRETLREWAAPPSSWNWLCVEISLIQSAPIGATAISIPTMRHRHDRPVAADTSAETPKITIFWLPYQPMCWRLKDLPVLRRTRLPHGAPPGGRVDYGADHDDAYARVDRSAN